MFLLFEEICDINLLMFLFVLIVFWDIFYVMFKIKELLDDCREFSVFLLVFRNKFMLEKFYEIIVSLVFVLDVLFLEFFEIFDEV